MFKEQVGSVDVNLTELEKLSLPDMLRWLTTIAKAVGDHVGVSDTRYTTSGIPAVINDEFVYFAEGFEIDEMGALGSKPQVEKMYKGKVLSWKDISFFELVPKP